MVRPLQEQFEPETVDRIGKLKIAFQSLPFQGEPARYLTREIVGCLEAGLLLAAVQVALSLLEMFFRELLVVVLFKEKYDEDIPSAHLLLDRIRQQIEDGRSPRYDLYLILDQLTKRGIVEKRDAGGIKTLYKNVRIPIHHGLTRRFVKLSMGSSGNEELEQLFLSLARFQQFDEMIEDRSLGHLEAVVSFVGKYSDDEVSYED